MTALSVVGTATQAVEGDDRTSHEMFSHDGDSFPKAAVCGKVAEFSQVWPPSFDWSRERVHGTVAVAEHGICSIQMDRPTGTTSNTVSVGFSLAQV